MKKNISGICRGDARGAAHEDDIGAPVCKPYDDAAHDDAAHGEGGDNGKEEPEERSANIPAHQPTHTYREPPAKH